MTYSGVSTASSAELAVIQFNAVCRGRNGARFAAYPFVRIFMSDPALLHGTLALFRPRYPAFSWHVFCSADAEAMRLCRPKVAGSS